MFFWRPGEIWAQSVWVRKSRFILRFRTRLIVHLNLCLFVFCLFLFCFSNNPYLLIKRTSYHFFQWIFLRNSFTHLKLNALKRHALVSIKCKTYVKRPHPPPPPGRKTEINKRIPLWNILLFIRSCSMNTLY